MAIRLPLALPFVFAALVVARPAAVAAKYEPPSSPRTRVSFNEGWKFLRADAAGAEQPGFDDRNWSEVTLPHTWNDTDTYRAFISHGKGDRSGAYRGIGWYRKHFQVPASARGGKVFLQFDGLRQAGRFWVNGTDVGRYENGITPLGLDASKAVRYGADNVIAVQVDNSASYKEAQTGVAFEWNSADFNPNFGGLNRNAWLQVTGPIYQTLPLYENLGTTGVYVYTTGLNLDRHTADVTVESQVRNGSGDFAGITLSAVVVDGDGNVCGRMEAEPSDLLASQTETFSVQGSLTGVHWWSPEDPALYTVYTILSVNGQPVDVTAVRTGFRKVEFRGGVGTGGVWLNGRFIWLTGYAQRAVDDWAGLGQAYPDWMHDLNAQLIRSTHANYLRWMHTAPQPVDSDACDRFGIVQVCPAGDKERDAQGRQWEQRAAVMRDTIIFYRNSPSIFFWEAGNTVVAPEHLQEMVALRRQWDPHGQRAMGSRGNDNNAANAALTTIGEFYGVMIGQAPQTDALAVPDALFRSYSAERRDRAPLIETEDFRDEAARGIWDDYSPPHFGFKPGPQDSYHWTSETFCLAGAARYHDYVSNRIDNHDPRHSKWSAYASIYWSDSDADGRQQSSEVLRVSGKVDGVRLPKEMYYVSRVMQSPDPDLHIIGHWTYPAGTRKTVFVAATHCDRVELYLNGHSLGVQTEPDVFIDPRDPNEKSRNRGSTGCIYAFRDVAFAPGALKAVATRAGRIVAQEQLETVGPPARLRLTPHTGPAGFKADGGDVFLLDFEAVDAAGRRCPTDEERVDFTVQGPAVWRGGLNSSRLNSTNNLYLYTECGINRVAVRSTRATGQVTITARRAGLPDASVTVESLPSSQP